MRGSRGRRALFAGAIALVPAVVACNAIVGLDDYRRTECGAFPCPYDGGEMPDVVAPDAGRDARPDAPPGAAPVSWAEFAMPNYRADAGIDGASPPNLAYTDNSAEVVTDDVTQLVWRRALVGGGAGQNLTLDEARAGCAAITANGPWRLPKRIELVTLLSYGHGAPFVDKAHFAVPSVKVWSSSEVRPLTPGAQRYWAVDFETGSVITRAGDDVATALCIKDKG